MDVTVKYKYKSKLRTYKSTDYTLRTEQRIIFLRGGSYDFVKFNSRKDSRNEAAL